MNATEPPEVPGGTSVGLAVGLPLFFLAVLLVAAALVYRFHARLSAVLRSGLGRGGTKEEGAEAPQDAAHHHHYTSLSREAPAAGQNPIYENLAGAGNGGYGRPQGNQNRLSNEEDLYLQCDLSDDAIYSNDPACSLAVHPLPEEDVYIVPES